MIAAPKAGRPKTSPYQKWLMAMQTMAWFSFVQNSGLNYKTIRIKFAPRSKTTTNKSRTSKSRTADNASQKHYGDRDRQWHRWSRGTGPVKQDVLQIVEQRIPDSMSVYEHGPAGSRIWQALAPDTNLRTELDHYSQPALHTNHLRLDSNTLMASPWHRISFRILTYRIRKDSTNQPILPGDDKRLSDAIETSYHTARTALLELLDIESPTLAGYGLYPQDVLYLLEPQTLANKNEVKFSGRETVWQLKN